MTLSTAARAAHDQLDREGDHIQHAVIAASQAIIFALKEDGIIEKPLLDDACAELEAAIYTYARACWQRDRAGA